MGDDQRGGLLLFNWGFSGPIYFEVPGKALVQSNVSLGIRELSGVEESIQEVGCRNCPSCLRNRLLPKLVQSALGVMGGTDSVPVNL